MKLWTNKNQVRQYMAQKEKEGEGRRDREGDSGKERQKKALSRDKGEKKSENIREQKKC